MAIDSNIALQASQQPNLLQTLSQATALKGAMQSQASNGALSRILQQSVDPATGQVNYDNVTKLAAQDPDAAYNLPALQAQILQQRTNQQQYDTAKIEQASKRSDFLSNGFGSLLASGNTSPEAIMGMAASGIKQGLFTADDAVNFTSQMPSDPAERQQWIEQHYIGFSNDSQRMANVMPRQQTINTGDQQIVTNFDPMTGKNVGNNTIFNNQMSPGEAATPTQIYDPATQSMRLVTKGQFANGAVNGAAPQQGAQAPAGGLGSGRMTDPGAQQAPAPGLGAPAQPAGPGIQAAPSLGAPEAASVTAQGNATAALDLSKRANAATANINQLQTVKGLLSDVDTGPGTDYRNQAKALATTLAPDIAAKLGINPDKVASYEELKKITTQIAQASGSGSDMQLSSAIAGNPNTGMTSLGLKGAADYIIANNKFDVAKNQAWLNSGLPPQQFNKFEADFNRDIPRTIFAIQDMEPARAQKAIQNMSPTDQIKFARSWQKAQAQGLVQ